MRKLIERLDDQWFLFWRGCSEDRAFWFSLAALPVLCALLAVLLVSMAAAQERVSFLGSYIDDGSCPEAPVFLEGEYSRVGQPLEAYGSLRVAPSGGDCRQNSTSYTVDLERSFDIAGSWDALAKFSADERSFAAPYAQVIGGQVDLRPDGQAAFPVFLPAGTAKTLTAGLGLSRSFGIGEVDLAVNLVPVDWSEHGPGQTLHLALNKHWDQWEFGVAVDVGRGSFGDARLIYRQGVAQIKADCAWGLNSIYDGAPAFQVVREARFMAAGAPQDYRCGLGVGLTWDLE